MSQQTITIRLYDDEERQIVADIYGAFAVHPPAVAVADPSKRAITHIATGRVVCYKPAMRAGEVARALNAALTDGDFTEADFAERGNWSERYRAFVAQARAIVGPRWEANDAAT